MGLRSRSCLPLLLLVLLVPAALAASTCVNEDRCVLSCQGCTVGEYVPDPDDCRGYYRCVGTGVGDYYVDPFDCQSGEVFSSFTHLCEEGDSCSNCPSDPLSCVYECPATGNVFISASDECNTYYFCVGGSIELTLACDASTPYFDGTNCQTDESRCCYCHPYCSQTAAVNNERVPDPVDCRRYYTCFAEGTPSDSTECSSGEYYDSATQQCSNKITCHTTCTNVMGEDGCIDPYTCLNSGFFAKCPNNCTAEYYHCSEPTGVYQEVSSCTSGTVFHPTSHTCVSPSDCP